MFRGHGQRKAAKGSALITFMERNIRGFTAGHHKRRFLIKANIYWEEPAFLHLKIFRPIKRSDETSENNLFSGVAAGNDGNAGNTSCARSWCVPCARALSSAFSSAAFWTNCQVLQNWGELNRTEGSAHFWLQLGVSGCLTATSSWRHPPLRNLLQKSIGHLYTFRVRGTKKTFTISRRARLLNEQIHFVITYARLRCWQTRYVHSAAWHCACVCHHSGGPVTETVGSVE